MTSLRWPRFVAAPLLAALGLLGVAFAAPAHAEIYVPVSGAGSTWSQNAVDQWRRNVNQYGLTINFAGTGSSDGRTKFKEGTVDFAVTEIPYGINDQGTGVADPPPTRGFAYMPIVAGGTSIMYNLTIGGQRVTQLRLSGETLARIFTGVITMWNDEAIKTDNPGLAKYLPAKKIVPVVRSDGSGTTAQFTTWLANQYPALLNDYCARAGRNSPCGTTSYYPIVNGSGFVGQNGSLGVSGYVAQPQADGALTYVEYSYAKSQGFPVVRLLNKAGYYVLPTAQNVAVGLLGARINTANKNDPATYLTSDLSGVYNNTDRRAYPMSSYSYMVLPTAIEGTFSAEKGKSLSTFANYFLCEGQQQAEALGYSPLPINLVKAGLEQVKRIPGVVADSVDLAKCNNPTFSSDGSNTLAKNAPYPAECDKAGPAQCGTPTESLASGGSTGTGTSTGGTGTTDGTGTPGTGDTGTGGSSGTTDGTGSTGGGTTEPGAGTGGTGSMGGTGTGDSGAGATGSGGGSTQGGTSGGSTDGFFTAAVPTTLPGEPGFTPSTALMIGAVVVLIGVAVGPPLVAQRIAAKRDGSSS